MRADPARPVQLWLLALITISGTLAMHIFVPALPHAAQDFGASAGVVQLTLSTYIAGLALGQLTYGPVSDRYGRRPALIVGMIIYAIASLAAMLAPTIGLLIAARLFQAIGGCAGLVLGRAIVRDRTTGEDTARNLSLLNLMVMAGPGLSPLVGSALAETTGWRSIFAAVSLLGLFNLLLILRRLPETAPRRGNARPLALGSYRFLLGSRTFLGLAFGGACATTSIYAFIGAAPFIFVAQLHRPSYEVGPYLTVTIVGAWFGSLAASRLIGRIPTRRLMELGNLLSCASAAAFLLLVLSGWLSVASTLVPMLALTFGAGIASPTALAESMGVNPQIAGSASGLYGFAQMSIGAACTTLGAVGGNPALAAAAVLLAAALLAQAAAELARRAS